jgi:hypothetical protein
MEHKEIDNEWRIKKSETLSRNGSVNVVKSM